MAIDLHRELPGRNQLSEESRPAPHIELLIADSRGQLRSFLLPVIIQYRRQPVKDSLSMPSFPVHFELASSSIEAGASLRLASFVLKMKTMGVANMPLKKPSLS